MTSFAQRLDEKIKSCRTPALIGIDPRWDMLPPAVQMAAAGGRGTIAERTATAFESFSRQIVEIVAPLVPAIKPQVAFFEQLGVPGCRALHAIMSHARRVGLIVIADAKRGDIGSTAEAYADAWLAGEDPEAAAWPADALTVNPYLGSDSLKPFVDVATRRGAGIYVLVRTSNPGAADLQDRQASDGPLYETVGQMVQNLTNQHRSCHPYGSVGAVVGATWPQQLASLRAQMPNVPFLIPGYGTQGGTSTDSAHAFDESGHGAIVNSSRGINFAWTRKPYSEQFGPERWQDAVAAATQEMIADLAAHTPARQLKS